MPVRMSVIAEESESVSGSDVEFNVAIGVDFGVGKVVTVGFEEGEGACGAVEVDLVVDFCIVVS